jgi:bifunctional DNA-binding transcriptional regulator/antitoxin component of YhaV-PrlF toxin-antitoxin module
MDVVKIKRRRGYTRVSPKHQVTLPAQAMAEAGLHVGDRLRVAAAEPGRVLLVREGDPLDEYVGSLTGTYQPDELDRLRDEWR